MSSWLRSNWHRNAGECLCLSFHDSRVDKRAINKSFSSRSRCMTAHDSSDGYWCSAPGSIPAPCPPPLRAIVTGSPLFHILGLWRGRAGHVCAWIILSLGAAGYMAEGLEKIVHNLWSMWIIFLWHLKNSWQREKCWVKGNNPLLPLPSFDCCNSYWKGLWEICWIRLVIVLPVP